MIKLKIEKNQKVNEILLIQILFYTFPLCFIIGNLAVSINTLLFIFVSFFVIQKKQLSFRFDNYSWILIIFFSYFFISTSIQFLIPGLLNEKMQHLALENNPIFKSFLLIRFLLLIFVVDTLFFNKILDLKKFFLSSLICSTFVSLDVIMQYVLGFDIFGYKSFEQWNSGPFGEEFIAGTYLKNFSFFAFFYIFKDKDFNKPLSIFIITLHLYAALLTGNRMPMILFLFGCVLIILLIKNLRFVMSVGLIIFISIFFIMTKYDKRLNHTYGSLINDINIAQHFKNNKEITQNEEDGNFQELDKHEGQEASIIILRHSGHNRVYRTAVYMWLEQPLTGFGLKSFRIKCWEILNKDINKIGERFDALGRAQNVACGNHPHNYYLELLSETGIIGTILLLVFFLLLLKESFFYIRKYNRQLDAEVVFIIPFVISFFLEIWPIKSTGSFFTTWGATFFWLNVAILIAAKSKKLN